MEKSTLTLGSRIYFLFKGPFSFGSFIIHICHITSPVTWITLVRLLPYWNLWVCKYLLITNEGWLTDQDRYLILWCSSTFLLLALCLLYLKCKVWIFLFLHRSKTAVRTPKKSEPLLHSNTWLWFNHDSYTVICSLQWPQNASICLFRLFWVFTVHPHNTGHKTPKLESQN